MAKISVKKLTAFWALSLILAMPPAWAGVTNEGNDAVQIEINRKSGYSQRINLYPGQSETLPDDATSIKIVPRGFGARGDESIMIKIVENNGNEGELDKYGQTYVLNRLEDEEAEIVFKQGSMTNTGNIVIDVTMTNRKGFTQKRTLYIDQSYAIPKDIYEVRVLSNRRLRGDERINLKVSMPDGVEHNITTLGGIARIEEEG